MKPLKKFGQNFLTDRYYLEKVVEAFAPKPGDKILEIGALIKRTDEDDDEKFFRNELKKNDTKNENE